MSDIKSKFLSRLFKNVGGLVWDLTTGKLGYKTDDGILTFSIDSVAAPTEADPTAVESVPRINANPFDTFSVDIPAFATNTPLTQVEQGDVLVGANAVLGFVVSKTAASLKYLGFDGHTKTYTPQKVNVLDVNGGVLVVKSLTSLLGGDQGRAGLESQLLPLLLLGGKNGLEDKLPLLLLGQLGGAGGGGNIGQMLLMQQFLGDGKGGNGMESILLMQALGGGGLFGGAPAAGAAQPAAAGLFGAGMNPMLLALLAGDGGLDGLTGGAKKSSAPSAPQRLQSFGTVTPPPLTRL